MRFRSFTSLSTPATSDIVSSRFIWAPDFFLPGILVLGSGFRTSIFRTDSSDEVSVGCGDVRERRYTSPYDASAILDMRKWVESSLDHSSKDIGSVWSLVRDMRGAIYGSQEGSGRIDCSIGIGSAL